MRKALGRCMRFFIRRGEAFSVAVSNGNCGTNVILLTVNGGSQVFFARRVPVSLRMAAVCATIRDSNGRKIKGEGS